MISVRGFLKTARKELAEISRLTVNSLVFAFITISSAIVVSLLYHLLGYPYELVDVRIKRPLLGFYLTTGISVLIFTLAVLSWKFESIESILKIGPKFIWRITSAEDSSNLSRLEQQEYDRQKSLYVDEMALQILIIVGIASLPLILLKMYTNEIDVTHLSVSYIGIAVLGRALQAGFPRKIVTITARDRRVQNNRERIAGQFETIFLLLAVLTQFTGSVSTEFSFLLRVLITVGIASFVLLPGYLYLIYGTSEGLESK